MSKSLAVVVGLFLAVLFSPQSVVADGAGNGIVGSVHDFTDNNGAPENDDSNVNAWNNARKEICRVCHVPHDHGEVRYGNLGILWNHQTTTKSNWEMYASSPDMLEWIDGTIEPAPAGVSRLCLGCHDGVSAINQYDGKTPADTGYGAGTAYYMDDYSESSIIGGTVASLTNNHPISVSYNNVNDTQLKDPASSFMANGDSVESLLNDQRVECSSCHDVHDREAVAGTHLLRERITGDDVTGVGASALCFACHDK